MSSPRAGKRRVDTDVIKLIESKHEVRDISGIKCDMIMRNTFSRGK